MEVATALNDRATHLTIYLAEFFSVQLISQIAQGQRGANSEEYSKC